MEAKPETDAEAEEGAAGEEEGESPRDNVDRVDGIPLDVPYFGSIDDVTFEDLDAITTNWFDSFPAALPTSIRDRLVALLEEFVVDPQARICLEICLALVGVVVPGKGIVSAEAAAETTFTFETGV